MGTEHALNLHIWLRSEQPDDPRSCDRLVWAVACMGGSDETVVAPVGDFAEPRN